jgi:hypothetical protein
VLKMRCDAMQRVLKSDQVDDILNDRLKWRASCTVS